MNTAEKYLETSKLSLRAADWVGRNAGVEGIAKCADALSTELLRLSNAACDGAAVLQNQPTIGVFGASQAGKSYLVNTLSAGGADLIAQWGGRPVEFMRDINPSGHDKEATGVVTRFTHADVSGITDFPIRLRVFRITEIVMILVNTFFHDFVIKPETMEETGRLLSPESFNPLYESIAADPSLILSEEEQGLGIVTPRDVVALADYARAHAGGVLMGFKADGEFWLKVRALAPKLNARGLTRLFAPCWGGLEYLTHIFEKLAHDAFKLKGADTVYCGLDGFLEPNPEKAGELKPVRLSLNFINTLLGLFDDQRRITLAFKYNGGIERAELEFASAAALTLELLFPLDAASRLQNFDVLDFPGARSREQFVAEDYLHQPVTGDMQVKVLQCLRRGKVAYLFDRYTQRREVDLLLFCINSAAQLEVTQLVTLLNIWIGQNVGETPELRAKLSSIPLLGVLTRFDETMKKEADTIANGQDSNAGSIVAGCFEHFKTCRWLNEWTPGKPLCQFFLVRRPGLCGELFDTDEQHHELSRSPRLTKMLPVFTAAFKSDPSLVHLYGDPDEALEAALELNDGGASRIISFISRNFTSTGEMRRRITENVEGMVERAESALGIYQSGGGAAAQSKAIASAVEVSRALYQCQMISRTLFARIRALLELDDDLLQKKYVDNWSPGKNAARFALECVELLKERIRHLAQGGGLAELAAIVNASWTREMRNAVCRADARERYSFFYDKSASRFIEPGAGLDARLEEIMRVYATELEKALSSLDLRGVLERALDENESVSSDKMSMSIRQSVTVQYLISAAMLHLGKAGFSGNLVLPRPELLGIEDDERALFDEKVVLSQETAQGFKSPIATLPEVSGAFRRACADHVLIDHLTAWAALTAGENLHAESPYKLSSGENTALNLILDGFFKLKGADA